jgi:hypothetical protein
MANVAHLLTGNYLNAAELAQAGPQVATIAGAEIKEFEDGTQKVIVSFHELDKDLPCNKTRLQTLVTLFGPDTAGWMNQRVMIHSQQLATGKFAGQYTILISKAPQQVPAAPAGEVTTAVF